MRNNFTCLAICVGMTIYYSTEENVCQKLFCTILIQTGTFNIRILRSGSTVDTAVGCCDCGDCCWWLTYSWVAEVGGNVSGSDSSLIAATESETWVHWLHSLAQSHSRLALQCCILFLLSLSLSPLSRSISLTQCTVHNFNIMRWLFLPLPPSYANTRK